MYLGMGFAVFLESLLLLNTEAEALSSNQRTTVNYQTLLFCRFLL